MSAEDITSTEVVVIPEVSANDVVLYVLRIYLF